MHFLQWKLLYFNAKSHGEISNSATVSELTESQKSYRLIISSPPPDISMRSSHDDVIKWKHFPRYWPFVRGIRQWRGALMFSLICVWINGWGNSRKAGDLRRYRAHYDVIAMYIHATWLAMWSNIGWRNVSNIYIYIGIACEYINTWIMKRYTPSLRVTSLAVQQSYSETCL